MKEGDIVSVITVSGEYIGKLVSNRHDCVELQTLELREYTRSKNGLWLKVFVYGLCQLTSVSIQNYVFMTETNDDIKAPILQSASKCQKRKRL